MRYTASATMEDRTLRDVERWKDKIEIRLDNRQVFFLFFGSALVACLLFILGVVVGKRLESRGRAAAPEIEDPLALLDRIAATPGAGAEDAITFPRTLIQSPPTKPDRKAGKPAARAEAKAEPPKSLPIGDEKIPTAEPASAPVKTVAAKPPAEVVVAKPQAKLPVAKPEAAPAPIKAAVPAEKVAPPVVAAKPPEPRALPADPKPAEANASDKKGRFTLQLGSFQSREEAEAFMAKFASVSPYIVTSEIPEKGRWYRVRVGNYASNEEAMQAKGEFERAHRQIAYVAPR